MKIKEIVKTCIGCPAQWEGRTADDRPLYVRYRWGELQAWVGEPGGEQTFGFEGMRCVLDITVGDLFDGYMEQEQLDPYLAVLPDDPPVVAGPSDEVRAARDAARVERIKLQRGWGKA